jgi:hypothetical protein
MKATIYLKHLLLILGMLASTPSSWAATVEVE